MQRSETMQEGAPVEMFQTSYAEAKRLIEQDNYDGAVDRLDRVKPESRCELWLWTDLMAALLFVRRDYARCHWLLSEYDSRFPGDRRVEYAMALLREAYL